MQSLRQLGGGVVIAILSVLLVIGGISLSLAETLPARATPTAIPPTLSLVFPTATFTMFPSLGETSTATLTATPVVLTAEPVLATNTLFVPVSCLTTTTTATARRTT